LGRLKLLELPSFDCSASYEGASVSDQNLIALPKEINLAHHCRQNTDPIKHTIANPLTAAVLWDISKRRFIDQRHTDPAISGQTRIPNVTHSTSS
jgi:hypothetical protein